MLLFEEALAGGAEETKPYSIKLGKTEVVLNSAPNVIRQFRNRMSVADLSLGAAGSSGKL